MGFPKALMPVLSLKSTRPKAADDDVLHKLELLATFFGWRPWIGSRGLGRKSWRVLALVLPAARKFVATALASHEVLSFSPSVKSLLALAPSLGESGPAPVPRYEDGRRSVPHPGCTWPPHSSRCKLVARACAA